MKNGSARETIRNREIRQNRAAKAEAASSRQLSVDYMKSETVVGAVEREVSLPLRDRLQVAPLEQSRLQFQ